MSGIPKKIDLDLVERNLHNGNYLPDQLPPYMLALIARIHELEAVAAVAYDLTHEEGAISLQVGDTVDAEDLAKIDRHVDALLQLGRLYRRGAVLP